MGDEVITKNNDISGSRGIIKEVCFCSILRNYQNDDIFAVICDQRSHKEKDLR